MALISQLGYLGFEVSDLAAWAHFSQKVLGLELTECDGGFSLAMDSRRQRFVIREGPSDDLSFVGWELSDSASMETMLKRLHDAGVETSIGNQAECARRGVEALLRFMDPSGTPLELFLGPESRFQSRSEGQESVIVQGGFVAEEMGLGHLVVNAKSLSESLDFYCTLFGFALSDRIRCEIYGYKVDIAFLHVNRRHHSLAIGENPGKRMHHFMIEAKNMDEVGLAYDRAIRNKVTIAQTLGRHPNDRMFSFYALTPSGFQFEFGWGGRVIDPNNWDVGSYDQISEWGHHPPALIGRRGPKVT